MSSIYHLKSKFQATLRPLVNLLAKIGITANQITILAILGSLCIGVLLGLYPTEHLLLISLPLFLFFRMALNAIDGMLAREHHLKTNLGAYLNELGDIISDTAIYLAFAFMKGFKPELIVMIVILAIISETVGIMGQTIGASRRYDGPMGKSDRAFAFGLLALLVGLGFSDSFWLLWIQWTLILLLILTIGNRMIKALAESHE